jgi:hypothetical protein
VRAVVKHRGESHDTRSQENTYHLPEKVSQ